MPDKKKVVRTSMKQDGELHRRWEKYLQKQESLEAPALRSLIKQACDDAGI